MHLWPISAIAGLSLLCAAQTSSAPVKVQFSREVLPILNRECLGCHRGSAAPGGYSLESARSLIAGGRHGAAVIPGQSGKSSLVRYLTGDLKPQMPPGKPLPLDTVALLRRWIDEGAKIDAMAAPSEVSGIMRGAMPLKGDGKSPAIGHGLAHSRFLPAPVRQSAPVTAIAFSTEGKLLAVGGYRAVRILDSTNGSIIQTLTGPVDQVTSIAWSPDGKLLAAAGGVPGMGGEVCIWATERLGDAPKVLRAHADTITCLAWRPGTAEFATSSLDKTVRIWDATAARVTRTLKDHVDMVFSVAYSPDGKWMGTGSGDRTLKLYLAGTGTRVSSFSHAEGVAVVAFGPGSDLVIACADKQVRVWPVKAGTVENPLRGQGEGEAINAAAFSSDGSLFIWGASNRKVRLWNGDVSSQRREMNDCQDWVYAVAASPSGKMVAAGAADGRVYFWSADDGHLLRSVAVGKAQDSKPRAGGVSP